MITQLNDFIKKSLCLCDLSRINRGQLTILCNYIKENFPEFNYENAKELVGNYSLIYYIIENSELINELGKIREDKENDEILMLLLNAYCDKNNLEYTGEEELLNINMNGEYYKNLQSLPDLYEDDSILFEQLKENKSLAREKLIHKYLPYVYWFVISEYKKHITSDTEFIDFIQVGNLTLINAVDKFDNSQDCKFVSYLSVALNRRLSSYYKINKDVIKRRAEIVNKIRALYRESERFYVEHGHIPSAYEMSKYIQLDPKEIEELQTYDLHLVSLENEMELNEEYINDYSVDYSCEEKNEQNLLSEFLWDALNNSELKERDKEVIRLIYQKGYTHLQIGNLFGVSHQRIGQIHQSALALLRENKQIRSLRRN